jgi:hypothetical protein
MEHVGPFSNFRGTPMFGFWVLGFGGPLKKIGQEPYIQFFLKNGDTSICKITYSMPFFLFFFYVA